MPSVTLFAGGRWVTLSKDEDKAGSSQMAHVGSFDCEGQGVPSLWSGTLLSRSS